MPTNQLMDEISKRKAELDQHGYNVSRIKKELKQARRDSFNAKSRFENALRWLEIRYAQMTES